MNIRPLLHSILVASLCPALPSLAATTDPAWDYGTGKGGPAHWSQLDPQFEACSAGSYQSPVDIRDPLSAALPPITLDYPASDPTLIHAGHTLKVRLAEPAALLLEGKRYALEQLHFHTPGEIAFLGRRAEMSMHMVHRNPEGRLLVLAVLLQTGADNPAYAPIFSHLPRTGERIVLEHMPLQLRQLLPPRLASYRFEGSLTTPPCSEGVQWIVLQEPVRIGTRQLQAFRQQFKDNARPIQPMNQRTVTFSEQSSE